MKVLFDYQAFIQNIGGVSRYHIELMENFSEDIHPILPNILSDNLYLKDYNIQHCSVLPKNNSTFKKNIYKLFNILQSRLILKTKEYDIFHPTFYNPYYIAHSKAPVVITIHDLNHDKFPKLIEKSEIVQRKEKLCCDYANAIIAISNETKLDLIKYHNIPENKISVIYHGVDQNPVKNIYTPLFTMPYILYIGGRRGYKNFNKFLQGFSMVSKDIHLVCTGVPFNSSELEIINKLNLKNRIHQYFATEDELLNLLCNAIAFVYPSIGEGFGLPILEAFRCSCPCIISDIMCFHEVADSAASYFNPHSPDDISSVINKTLSDIDLLEKQKKEGLKRMKLFTWKKTAQETEKLYRSLIY